MFRPIAGVARIALALLLLAAPLAALEVPLAAPPIVGRVTDTFGVPISNARVVLSGSNRATTTGSDGSFIFRSVPAGRYHVDASFPGYRPSHVEVVVPPEGGDVSVEIQLISTPIELEGVLVTGTPGGSDPLTITQSATQLAGHALDREIAATIAETLQDEPGITTRYAGPASAMPVIRGLTGERVVMLQNGERTGDLSGASADHATSVDPLSATRVEVVRGPASLLYGSSAVGGVVNVIGTDIPNNVPSRIEGYLAAQGISVTPGGAASGQAIVPMGEYLALAVGGGLRSVGDLRVGGGDVLPGTDLTNFHGNAGIGYVGESLSGGVAFSGYDFEYGIPSTEPVDDAEDAEQGVTLDGRRYETKGRMQWTSSAGPVSQLDVSGSAQWYTHDEIEPSGEVGTNFRLATQTADLRANTDVVLAKGTVGASGLARQYEPTGEEALTPPASSITGGVFFFQEIPLGTGDSESLPRLQVGGRYDGYRIRTDASETFGSSEERTFGSFSGSVGINVPVGDGLSLGGSVARAFRAPTVEELYSNGFHAAVGSFDIGNPDLRAETNLGAEGLVRVQMTRVSGLISAYYNRIDDFIAPNLIGDTTIVTEEGTETVPLNIYRQEDAALRGIEGEIELEVVDHVVVGARADVVRGRFSDHSPLPFMPAAHLGGEVRWDNGGLGVGIDAEYAFAQDDVAVNEFATGDYTLAGVNVSFSRTVGGRVHSITVRADNVFDEVYREATSRIKEFAPNPGRNITAVYRLLF